MPTLPTSGDLYQSADQTSTLRIHPLHQAIQVDYVGGANPIYVGWAPPGTAAATATWRICKITWDGNNNPTAVQWANGRCQYESVWTNRAALPYA